MPSQKLLFVSLHKFCSRARRHHARSIERAIFSRFASARRSRRAIITIRVFDAYLDRIHAAVGSFCRGRSGRRRRDIISRDGARALLRRLLRRRFNDARARAHTPTHRTKNRARERTTAKTTTDRRRHALSSSSSCRKSPPNPSPNGRR